MSIATRDEVLMASALAAFNEKALCGEWREVESRLFTNNLLGAKLTDDRRKFEAMAGAGARDEHLRMFRVPIEDKMFIGGVGVQTHNSAL